MGVIVDTNVAMVASKRAPQANAACINACINKLYAIMQDGGLFVDDQGLILNEYIRRLGHAGQPGAGEKFVKWAFNNQWIPETVRQIAITRCQNQGWRYFNEFPDQANLQTFDGSDQKFVAVAVASGENPPIFNAVDSDWWNHREALTLAGIRVEFLCPQHAPAC